MSKLPAVVKRRDVALRAGVSPTSVSLVLNRTPGTRISDAARERVFAAAADLGYSPSAVARALVTGKTSTIGVVLHFRGNPFHLYSTRILDGVWAAIKAGGYRILIAEGSVERCVAGLFQEKAVDGVLVIVPPLAAEDAELRNMRKAGFPAVFIGANRSDAPGDYVDLDNFGVGVASTEALLKAGHTRILHIAGSVDENSAARDRQAGYQAALKSAGILVDDALIVPGNFLLDSGASAMREALSRKVRFSAIFAANDSMAASAIEVLHEVGMNIPADVSIIGVNGFGDEQLAGIQLATWGQPLGEIGRVAGDFLMERINGYQGGVRTQLLAGNYLAGNSIAQYIKE